MKQVNIFGVTIILNNGDRNKTLSIEELIIKLHHA